MDITADKNLLRQRALKARRTLVAMRRSEFNNAITGHLIKTLDWGQVRRVQVYRSKARLGEVDTAQLVRRLRANWPQLQIDFAPGDAAAPLERFTAYDVVIVPVVAFDAAGNRLGMGGGWYDRFLASQPQAYVIGLAYELQRAAAVPVEPHDRRLDLVVTERNSVR